jgi:hypothetical protein
MAGLVVVSHTLSISGGGSYQNADINAGNFLPFGFSGAVFSRKGDNIQAVLTFPRNSLADAWATSLVNSCAVCTVREVANGRTVFSYAGQATSSSISDEVVSISLSSVLDAVGFDVPWRYLTEDAVGPLPTMSGARAL